MSADSEKVRGTLADRLASFDDKLRSTPADVDMLAEIQDGIGTLLATEGVTEAEVRRVLQDRYENGGLRKETFQLVKSMLDRYVTEKIQASPSNRPTVTAAPPQPEPAEDSFGATTVIPTNALPVNDADARVQVGSVLRDRFMLQEKVSGGSMGVVYKALDRRLAEAGSDQSSVAIKVLSPQLAENGDALRALQQEASKTRCLVHPNIVRFIDLDRDDDLYFLVLEWLDGRTLADILDSPDARGVDVEAAFRITHQVGEALDYAHKCGIVHADVKPGNIMVMPNGVAKLFDFGVARVRQKHVDSEFDPGVLGALTPAYSSMQVLGGEDPVAADDVFSLGCLLYRLVAGYRVFGPRNAAEASQEGMTPQRPHGLSDAQWKVLKKSLSYARVTRYKTIREFLDALGDHQCEQTITIDEPERFVTDDGGSPGKWIATIVILLGLSVIGARQLGYLDPWLEKLQGSDGIAEIAAPVDEPIAGQTAAEEPDSDDPITETDPATGEAMIVETIEEDPIQEFTPPAADPDETTVATEPLVEATIAADEETRPADTTRQEDLVDFSKLPPPTMIVHFTLTGAPDSSRVILREDGDPVVIDFIRDGGAETALTLRLEEIGFSGNRSPWGSGQYALSNAGLLTFPPGQERARITLTAASDPRREPDQQSTLRLRLADSASSELALIDVTLEDDDQRAFEDRLPVNTIAFASNQVSVSEADPAVQIDIIRFNPDNASIEVGFTVEDISATEGEDYFAPSTYTISFGPGQRSARLLIPLVQDSRGEGDEAFVVKLALDTEALPADVSPNIAVMIRDDEF